MTRTQLVAHHLQHFAEGRREVARYREALKVFDRDTMDDTIESLTFRGEQGGSRVQCGKITDPTPQIAGRFRRTYREETVMARRECLAMTEELAFALDCIQKCVEALAPNKRRIIEQLYFEGLSWEEVTRNEFISHSTLQYRRNKALDEISKMPLYLMMCFADADKSSVMSHTEPVLDTVQKS